MSTYVGDAVNIERGLFRLFLIGLIPVFLYAYELSFQATKKERDATEQRKKNIAAELTYAGCQNMAAMKGANMNMELLGWAGDCSSMGMYWNEAMQLSNETGKPINEELFNTILDNDLKEWNQKVYLLGLTVIPVLYVLASLMLYVAYRILRWGFAGFKSK